MADYAGAVAAMRARFVSAWGATTAVMFQNEVPSPDPLAVDPPLPWVYFEVIQTVSIERGVGLPGSKVWLTSGNIFLHVFAPLNYALPDQLALAVQAGEIFRAATFYVDNTAGAKIVTSAPSVGGGDSSADNGNWFVVTVSIPFEFYFIA
jgi:hypothetical protein